MPRPTTPARTGDPTDDYHALSTTARSSMSRLSPPSRAQRDAHGPADAEQRTAISSNHTCALRWRRTKPLPLRPMGFGIDAGRVHSPRSRAWGRLRPRAVTFHQLAVLQVPCPPGIRRASQWPAVWQGLGRGVHLEGTREGADHPVIRQGVSSPSPLFPLRLAGRHGRLPAR